MLSVAGSPDHVSRCLRVGEIDWDAVPAAGAPRSAASFGEMVLKVHDLSKRYGQVSANDSLTFDARRGETVAIVGGI